MRIAGPHEDENAFWQAKVDRLDSQTSPGKALVYSGDCPARSVAVDGGNTLIAEFVLQKPCAVSIANGILTFAAIPYAIVLSSAAHSFVRFVDGAGAWVMDCDSGIINMPLADGSYPVVGFNAASYAVGGLLVPTTLTLRFPD